MVLSYHPCFEAEKNLICAGREPDLNDLSAIKAAKAVILPQGCTESLYRMASKNCSNVFPCFDAKFNYPGKTGQAKLFSKIKVPHPKTKTFDSVKSFSKFNFPFVFKFNWGGQGNTVFFVDTEQKLNDLVQKAEYNERTGWHGFLIQEYIPSQNRTLRVAVIGETFISYWRVIKKNNSFCANLASGAIIDTDSDPELQKLAISYIKNFCNKTGINLAGFDILFSSKCKNPEPLFLEINYFFGRQGLGGSEKYYQILNREIENWLKSKFSK